MKAGSSQPEFFYYQNDHLGTPQQLLDTQGQVVWRMKATAFGETRVDPASTVTNNLRFPGQYYDEETNTHQNYFRDYGPEIGRYVQADPIGSSGGVNYYVYVKSEPISHRDEKGLIRFPGVSIPIPRTTTQPGKPAGSGCGDLSTDKWVPDSFYGYDFSKPCGWHDDCYGRCGSKKSYCDQGFYSRMMDVCGQMGFLDRVVASQNECRVVAYVYYQAVVSMGCDAFMSAQRNCPGQGCDNPPTSQ